MRVAELTRKQQLFVHEYLVDMNATQAAIRAGFSEKTARQQASRMLSNVNVKRGIEEAWRDKIRRADITADDVLRLIARSAFADIRDFVEWDSTEEGFRVKPSDRIDGQLVTEVSEETREFPSGMRETTRRLKLVNKEQMIKLLAQHFGLAENKLKVDLDVSLADVLNKAWESM
ncbi:MAG: terminase small subunit [Alicyclobacillus sp.]|nr:terminase small subunit [Alicyclobacillus sp.]